MGTSIDLESTTLIERVVLLSMASLSQRDQTPAQPHEIRRCCRRELGETTVEVIGTPSESDVTRALYSLESHDLVTEVHQGEHSPVGKGRPSYALAVEGEAVLAAIGDESPLDALVERLQQS